jgi:xanthosine utilization system XapX-like protein
MGYRSTGVASLATLLAAAVCLVAGFFLPHTRLDVPAWAALAAVGLLGVHSTLVLKRLTKQLSQLEKAIAERSASESQEVADRTGSEWPKNGRRRGS